MPWRQYWLHLLVSRERGPKTAPQPPPAERYAARCGDVSVAVFLRDGQWRMAAAVRDERAQAFRSPFVGHAQRTAEYWFGPAPEGWAAQGGERR